MRLKMVTATEAACDVGVQEVTCTGGPHAETATAIVHIATIAPILRLMPNFQGSFRERLPRLAFGAESRMLQALPGRVLGDRAPLLARGVRPRDGALGTT